MTYWDRIRCSASYFNDGHIQRDRLVTLEDINKIEVWYIDRDEKQGVHEIFDNDECYDFLSENSSFENVQIYLNLSCAIDHISCVNIIDKVNIEYYKIEYPSNVYDKGTIEEFYKDGPSMLEKEIEQARAKQGH
jgi:hypothetical protein